MEEEVKGIFKVLGLRRWREFMTDRENWKDIFRQATKVHSGL
jgi:hypothetical protein